MSSYIGRININNTEYPIAQSLFGTCNTTANTATKVVTCADFDTLISGIVINVYFTYANTESSISLNVNSTGNKTVYVDNNSSILWNAGATKSFVYYNNQWRLINPTSVGTTYSAATTETAGLMSADDKKKLNSVASSATYNLAFKAVKVGNTDLIADAVDDTLTITAGDNVTLTPNSNNDSFSIAAENTTYAAGSGLSLSGTTFNHTNSITASSVGSSVATSGATLDVPYAKYDAQGHITEKGVHVHTIGSLAASAITSGTFATARIPSLPTSIIISGTFATARIPNLPASIITSGTFATARIPNLPASIITSGTFSTARLPVSTSVENNNNLPTGAAIQSYITGLGYEANQNAFTTVKVGTTDLVADSKTDTLTITAGNNITLTPTASSDSFSIAATNTTYGNATSSAAGLMSAADKQTLDGLVASGGEVNQNAFSNVVVGSSTVAADQKTDTLTLAGAGSVTLSANTSTDTITITGTDTTYGNATTAAAGLMSAADKIVLGKWNNIALDPTFNGTSSSIYIPYLLYNSSTTAQLIKCSETPIGNAIARYRYEGWGAHLTSTTPATSTNSTVVATTQFVHNAIAASISEGILKGIRINSSDSYVSSLSSNVYLITHNQGFAENFTSTVMVKDSSSSYFYQAINDDGVSLVYTNGKIRYDIFDIQENQFKIEFSSVPYQFSILINTNYDSLSLVDVDSTQTLLNI